MQILIQFFFFFDIKITFSKKTQQNSYKYFLLWVWLLELFIVETMLSLRIRNKHFAINFSK